MDLLYAMRDLGVAPNNHDRVPDVLVREIRAAPLRRAPLLSRRGRNRVAALAGAGVLAASSGVAVAAGWVTPSSLFSGDSPTTLLRTDPAWLAHQPTGATPVVDSTVSDLGTVSVPGVGSFQYWGAQTRTGAWCAAFRGPDGKWAPGGYDRTYNFGGVLPGCGAFPDVDQGGGFHFIMDEVGPNLPGNPTATLSALIYGTIDDPGSATAVVDATTGTRVPLFDGHYFALVLPRANLGSVRLQAVDASGEVVRQAEPFTP